MYEPQVVIIESKTDIKDELLFIHGWPDTGQVWNTAVDKLSKNGYRCIVVSLPGYRSISSMESPPMNYFGRYFLDFIRVF